MEPVGKCDDNFHLIDGPEGDQGSSILEGSFVFPGTHSEALVYARLIAAAPELYEALLELADMPASGLVHAAPWDKARAALAKASGK